MDTASLEEPTSSRAAEVPPSTHRTLVTTGVGNALEWYDWGIYATFSIYFATEIFAPHDPVAAILGAMAVFAVGLVVRPLGGLVFGWLADRRGRRTSMLLTVGLASLGSLMIALVPSYAAAGVGAPVLLLLARVLQGLAHGGEMPTAQTYLAEMAPRERRGRWASLIYVSGTSGVLAGVLMGVILDLMLSDQDMSAWDWRIPFLAGAVLGVWALISRVLLAESPHYQDERRTRRSAGRRPSALRPMLAGHWRESVQVVGLVVGGTVCFYVWSVSAIQQAVVVHGMSQGTALQASLVSNLILIFTLPLWGPCLIGSAAARSWRSAISPRLCCSCR
ncbi:MFS transporter [Micrococcus terreus]|uniref:MFS transporter, MHS family, alpha-ketoglutarate permease n=1 Tax=Micrococcus terreus TaxID=574650 RepID=A0A1I7MJI2_9MICC|nr:MFS transporter [Micrococcus terreus]SFV22019.1 MFS transporter, MHS family, alpha-ketoglutarate permease [Micrococcus terreus]